MKKIVIVIGVTLSFVFMKGILKAQYAYAQDPPTAGSCIQDINRWMSLEQRVYRSVLFGKKEAKDDGVGALRYSKDGDAWIKTKDDEWKSLASGFETVTWSDVAWETQDETDVITGVSVRRGLFEMKQLLTSELVPSITQSIRALQCRLRSVCLAAYESMQIDAPMSISVQPDGCLPIEYPRFEGCVYTEGRPSPYVEANVRQQCEVAARSLLLREMDIAKLIVSYDAGYRTLLQFAGIFERYLTLFTFQLVKPLQEAAQMIDHLNRIPCFISECNE
jgi:hypothetical protein